MPVPTTDRLAEVASNLDAEVPVAFRDLVHGPCSSSAWVGGAIFYGFLENA